MRRKDGAQTAFEVYCQNCQTSFAAGTKRCVHCGGRTGGARPVAGMAHPGQIQTRPGTAPPLDAEIEEADEAPVEMSLGRRLGGLVIWVVLVLGATIMRLCEGS